MTPAEIAEALTLQGLPGWRGSIHADPEAVGRKVATLHSPDYLPPTRGRLVVRRGKDAADAFAQAVEAAKGRMQ
jgi:hypothetical protein